VAGTAQATTHWYLGTILAVENDKGMVVLRVVQDLHNYVGETDITIQRWKIPPQYFIYLDGKESTAEEAFAPGRSIAMFDDFVKGTGRPKLKSYAVMVTSAPGAAQTVPLTDPACSMIMVSLSQPGRLNALCDGTPIPIKRDTKEVLLKRWATMRIAPRLIVERSDDGSLRGFAFTSSRHNYHPQWHPADVSGLTFADGQLSGTVTVRYTSQTGAIIIPASYELAGKADGSGSFTGTCEEKAVAGNLTITGLSSTRPQRNFRLWLRCEDSRLKGGQWGFLNATFTDDKTVPEAQLCFRKGHHVATITDMQLTRTGCKIGGNCTARGLKMSLDAEIYDGRLVVGNLTVGEGENAYRVSVSGGLLLPAAAPTIHPKHD
jgi:hypothetical protein